MDATEDAAIVPLSAAWRLKASFRNEFLIPGPPAPPDDMMLREQLRRPAGEGHGVQETAPRRVRGAHTCRDRWFPTTTLPRESPRRPGYDYDAALWGDYC